VSDMIPTWAVNAIGVAAGLCSIVSFIPQILKIWRERDASGVSLRMFIVTSTAFLLWTLFGIFQDTWPLIAANATCLALALTIVALRLKFGDEPPQRDQK
jgi:MtN3 and saliva related transmembrane protein